MMNEQLNAFSQTAKTCIETSPTSRNKTHPRLEGPPTPTGGLSQSPR